MTHIKRGRPALNSKRLCINLDRQLLDRLDSVINENQRSLTIAKLIHLWILDGAPNLPVIREVQQKLSELLPLDVKSDDDDTGHHGEPQ